MCLRVYVCVYSALTKLNWPVMCVCRCETVGYKVMCACGYVFVITSENTLTTVQSDTAVGVCLHTVCVCIYLCTDCSL